MANLHIKGMNDDYYAQIKALACSENRSVSQQILFMTKEYLLKRQQAQAVKMPAQVLLELSGSWEDDRTADEIIADLKQSRGKHISGSGCFLPATSEKL
jgi:hypothetical protein